MALRWEQDEIAGVPLPRFTLRAGRVDAGMVAFDASNGFWTWWSPFSDEAWGHAPTQAAAQQGLELWLRGLLRDFRPLLE